MGKCRGQRAGGFARISFSALHPLLLENARCVKPAAAAAAAAVAEGRQQVYDETQCGSHRLYKCTRSTNARSPARPRRKQASAVCWRRCNGTVVSRSAVQPQFRQLNRKLRRAEQSHLSQLVVCGRVGGTAIPIPA